MTVGHRAAAYEKAGTTMTCHRQGSALKASLATGVPAQHTREDGVRRCQKWSVLPVPFVSQVGPASCSVLVTANQE